MRLLMIVLWITFIPLTKLQAQTTYTCNYRQDCNWNDLIEQYDNCIGGSENSIFVLDKSESSITETIQNVLTVHKIKSKERKKKSISIYLVATNSGDIYYYIFDSKKKEVRVLSKKNGKAIIVIYSQGDPMLLAE